VSPATEIALVAGRELRKSVRSVKGIILGILTLLGSFLAVLICIWIESGVRKDFGADSTAAFQAAYEKAAVQAGSDPGVAHYVAHMPISLITFLKVLVWLGPLLVALLGFDSVSGDLQHRGVRYWTVRSRRWSYLLGKFFGLWGIVSVVTLTLMVLSSLAVLIRGYISIGDFFTWGVRCWVVSALIVGTWTAVATFVSSRFKTPLLALLSTFAAFFCMWLPGFIGWAVRWGTALQENAQNAQAREAARAVVANIRWYEYLYPNGYDDLLLSPKPLHVAEGIGACAVYMIVFVGLAAALFAKKDV
jgi:ABC-type transport system involved in multi-copper enzyme maturation permease subunit